MNNKLFTTQTDTATLEADYKKYIDLAAYSLIAELGENWEPSQLEARAKEDALWGSWVVSASKRSFAFHQACFAVNPSHTMGGVRPTQEATALAVGKHILQRCHELSKKVRAASYKLLFVRTNRHATEADIYPHKEDDDNTFVVPNRKVALEAASRYYQSYRSMGIDPPPMKLVSFTDDNIVIEEVAIEEGRVPEIDGGVYKVDIASEVIPQTGSSHE